MVFHDIFVIKRMAKLCFDMFRSATFGKTTCSFRTCTVPRTLFALGSEPSSSSWGPSTPLCSGWPCQNRCPRCNGWKKGIYIYILLYDVIGILLFSVVSRFLFYQKRSLSSLKKLFY